MTIPDDFVPHTMMLLASGETGARPIVAGESGVAGRLAGLLSVAASNEVGTELGLNTRQSRPCLWNGRGNRSPYLQGNLWESRPSR